MVVAVARMKVLRLSWLHLPALGAYSEAWLAHLLIA
jgi:hypothetical protein